MGFPTFGAGIVAVVVSNGNRIQRNVVARNSHIGIAGCCAASGNEVVARNVALGNGWADFAELVYDPLADGDPVTILDTCNNTWDHNVYATASGPDGCID